MSTTDVRIRVPDWDDPAFMMALQGALIETELTDRTACRAETARRLQAALRASGYPDATIEYVGSADDVLSGIARWIVHRGRPASESTR